MDPLLIAIRAAFAYVFLLAFVRMSGKRAVTQGTALDFVLALIMGDMVDDLIWAEVGAAQFVVALGTICVTRLALGVTKVAARPGGR